MGVLSRINDTMNQGDALIVRYMEASGKTMNPYSPATVKIVGGISFAIYVALAGIIETNKVENNHQIIASSEEIDSRRNLDGAELLLLRPPFGTLGGFGGLGSSW